MHQTKIAWFSLLVTVQIVVNLFAGHFYYGQNVQGGINGTDPQTAQYGVDANGKITFSDVNGGTLFDNLKKWFSSLTKNISQDGMIGQGVAFFLSMLTFQIKGAPAFLNAIWLFMFIMTIYITASVFLPGGGD